MHISSANVFSQLLHNVVHPYWDKCVRWLSRQLQTSSKSCCLHVISQLSSLNRWTLILCTLRIAMLMPCGYLFDTWPRSAWWNEAPTSMKAKPSTSTKMSHKRYTTLTVIQFIATDYREQTVTVTLIQLTNSSLVLCVSKGANRIQQVNLFSQTANYGTKWISPCNSLRN